MQLTRRFTTAVVVSLSIAGLTACSGTDPTPTPTAASSTAEAKTEQPKSEEPTATATEEPSTVAAGAAASWANPVTTGGELLTTISGTGFTVDVYEVGVTQATKTGGFVNPDTNQPIIPVGSDIVFVNYVVTNTGSETLSLGPLLIKVDGVYDDWPYMQGMDSVVDFALFEQMGVNRDAPLPSSYVDPYILAFEPGTSFSVGTNFAYQAGSPITFTATFVPVDANGDLLHDQTEKVTGQATIA